MRISTRRPKWDQFRESYVYRTGREQRVLGRVDMVPSLGYWWQTAHRTDVCYSLLQAKREVEAALQFSGDSATAIPPALSRLAQEAA